MNMEKKIIQGMSMLKENAAAAKPEDKKTPQVVLECVVCNECFIEDTRPDKEMECPHCCESMIPNYVGDVVPDGTEKADDNDLQPGDAVNGQVITYSSEGYNFNEGDESFDLHEFRMVRAIRGGKMVKVKVRTRKKRLNAKQKRALAKARKKANTSAAKRHRAKSMKIRRRAIGEGTDMKDVVDAVLQDLTNEFGLEIISKGSVTEEDGVYSVTVRVKDDDTTEVDLGDVEDTLTANNNADIEVIGPVTPEDAAEGEVELTLLVTPFEG